MKHVTVNYIELNDIGSQYFNSLKAILVNARQYCKEDDDIQLADCALNYQLYRKFLQTSMEETKPDRAIRMANLSFKYNAVVRDYLKQLGVTTLQRVKINNKNEAPINGVFDLINTTLPAIEYVGVEK